MTRSHALLGVDIGGSGMKGRLVDAVSGQLLTDRFRVPTPQPATPPTVSKAFGAILDHFDWHGPVGCTFPGVVGAQGMILTAANMDPAWIGVDAAALFGEHDGATEVVMVNDADAAAIAEDAVGAAADVPGVVLVVTFGTGIGSGLIANGHLVPNTEFGHIEIDGVAAEVNASSRAKDRDGLDFNGWIPRVNRFLQTIEDLVWPDLIVFGGGISKHFDRYRDRLDCRTPVVPATLQNEAGIVGAAMHAAGNS